MMDTYRAFEEKINDRVDGLEQLSQYALNELRLAIAQEANPEPAGRDHTLIARQLYADLKTKLNEFIPLLGIPITGVGDAYAGRITEPSSPITYLFERYMLNVVVGQAAVEALFTRKNANAAGRVAIQATLNSEDSSNELRLAVLDRLYKFTEISNKTTALAQAGRLDLILDALDTAMRRYPRPLVKISTEGIEPE